MQSDQALYQLQVQRSDTFPKMEGGLIQFKKFSRIRVNYTNVKKKTTSISLYILAKPGILRINLIKTVDANITNDLDCIILYPKYFIPFYLAP